MTPQRNGSRPPTLQEALDALREWHALTAEDTRQIARERQQATLRAEGWSPTAIREEIPQTFYEEPPGLPEHLADRKSKGKRGARKPRKFVPWYYR